MKSVFEVLVLVVPIAAFGLISKNTRDSLQYIGI